MSVRASVLIYGGLAVLLTRSKTHSAGVSGMTGLNNVICLVAVRVLLAQSADGAHVGSTQSMLPSPSLSMPSVHFACEQYIADKTTPFSR